MQLLREQGRLLGARREDGGTLRLDSVEAGQAGCDPRLFRISSTSPCSRASLASSSMTSRTGSAGQALSAPASPVAKHGADETIPALWVAADVVQDALHVGAPRAGAEMVDADRDPREGPRRRRSDVMSDCRTEGCGYRTRGPRRRGRGAVLVDVDRRPPAPYVPGSGTPRPLHFVLRQPPCHLGVPAPVVLLLCRAHSWSSPAAPIASTTTTT